MAELTTGAGLAAFGFWFFVAAMIAVGVWSSIRKRDAEHETLRRIVESGQPIDDELVDKILAVTGGNQDLERDLRVGAWIVFSLAPGMLALGWGVSMLQPEVFPILAGVAALLAFLGGGFSIASRMLKKWYVDSEL